MEWGFTLTGNWILDLGAQVTAVAAIWKLALSPAYKRLKLFLEQHARLVEILEHETKPNGGRKLQPATPRDNEATVKDLLLDIRASMLAHDEKVEDRTNRIIERIDRGG